MNETGTLQYDTIIEAVDQRLANNERVRRHLPGEGRLKIDRQLPFLCVYREPPHADPGTRDLVTSEAAYLYASGGANHHSGVCELCQRIASTMQEHFGTFLFLEIWADRRQFEPGTENSPAEPSTPDGDQPAAGLTELQQPAFHIIAPDLESMPTTVQVLAKALRRISIDGMLAEVSTQPAEQLIPPGLQPLKIDCPTRGQAGRFSLGLAVRPIYRDAQHGTVFPMVLQSLRFQLAQALRRAIAEFTGQDSKKKGLHHESLGPTALVKAARLVDQQLCEVSESFDFLLQVTPVNSDQAWIDFDASGRKAAPTFRYRALPYRPSLLKRRLFSIEVERIEDTTLAHLFWEKQTELDRQLTALNDLGTDEFVLSSQQLYGVPEPFLVKLAEQILAGAAVQPPQSRRPHFVSVDEIAARAREEIDHYHQRMNEFNATVELRDDIASGIMVSHDRLLLSDVLKLRADRLEPLLHHEIGTHLLTYFNGRSQPFRQLYAGLSGYEELQEGLAVMAEYLTGGLTAARLRSLAARVLAVQSMLDRKSFTETFDYLTECGQIPARQAFVTALRVYRGGGFTKDIIYLRGVSELLGYLSRGHDMEPLYVGKIGLQHVPYVQEMRRRGIINAPGMLPRFWSDPSVQEKLETCRGLSVLDLLEKAS